MQVYEKLTCFVSTTIQKSKEGIMRSKSEFLGKDLGKSVGALVPRLMAYNEL